jgi:hypothetical protein
LLFTPNESTISACGVVAVKVPSASVVSPRKMAERRCSREMTDEASMKAKS